ncbi:MAG: patatin-like phospholipase family protein, partial [Elusimicrobiota bacterium]
MRIKEKRFALPIALTSGQKIINFLTDAIIDSCYFANNDFDRLPRRYRTICTDFIKGYKQEFSNGNMVKIIRASMAVPFAFTPVLINDNVYVDGGMCDNLPISTAISMGADYIIAVNAKPGLRPKEQLNDPLDYLDQVFSIGLLQQAHLLNDTTSIIVTPDLGDHLSTDFSDIHKLIRAGENAILPYIKEIKNELQCLIFSRSRLFAPTKIYVNGLPDFSTDSLKIASIFAPEMAVPEYRLQNIVDSLYLTGNFKWVELNIHNPGNGTEFSFEFSVTETLKTVKFINNSLFPKDSLIKLVDGILNQPINYLILHSRLDSVLRKYKEKGYEYADIDSIKINVHGDCMVYLNEGIIKKIEVQGNQTSKRHIVLREFPLKEGNVFSKRRSIVGIENIYATGFFENIYLAPSKFQGGIKLTLFVVEKGFDIIQIGARYDNVREGEGYLRYIVDNIFGLGYNFFTHLQYGAKREKYYLGLAGNRFINTYLTLKLKTYYLKDKLISD